MTAIEGGGVRVYRRLLAGMASSIVLIGVIFVFVVTSQKHWTNHIHAVSPVLVAAALVILAGICQLLARRSERPLDGSSDESYQKRLFLWVGFSETPVFVGIVTVVASGQLWFYPIGAIFAFIGFARIAPTNRNLARDQDELDRSEHPRSLISALNTVPPPGRR